MRLIHMSDLHFGPHYLQCIEVRLLEAIASLKPDTLVITGDLTHRARHREFKAAAEFLSKARELVNHIIICPGNHDIPMFRFWERLLRPFGRYRRYITTRLDYSEKIAGADLVALNSVRPYTRLVEGHLSSKQLMLCQRSFAETAIDDFRILATHHPIGLDDRGFSHPSMQLDWQKLCNASRLDLILTGHVHEAAVVPIHPSGCSKPLILVSCGSTTSSRGRGHQDQWNNFHLLLGSAAHLSVESFHLHPDRPFESFARFQFPRHEGHFRISPGSSALEFMIR